MTDVAGRTNQRLRTRTALLQAALELVREGRPPSMPDAAARALVSPATAYRYFSTADELWWEASQAAVSGPTLAAARDEIEAAGDDPVARLEALVRTVGFAMLDDQVTFRRVARGALDQWFAQADLPPDERVPVRSRRRIELIAAVVEPVRDQLPEGDVERIANALGTVVGTDVMLALVDGVGLDTDEARAAMLDAARWLLRGALAELDAAADDD